MNECSPCRTIKAASLLETIIASVIILISYGYFMITFIQINRPDKNSQQIVSYYEQEIICDSIKSITNTDISAATTMYSISHALNSFGNEYIKVTKENNVHVGPYKSYVFFE
jgi:SAM-dependent MidA family methyltransferase